MSAVAAVHALDLAPLRLIRAPIAEPPYDAPGARPTAPDAPALRPARPVDGPAPARAHGPRRLHVAGTAAPAPDRWAQLLARGIVEVVAGDRPATQLAHWTSPLVYAVLCYRARAALAGGAGHAARPRAVTGPVHVCRPADGVAEVASVVHARERAWALAFRLETRNGRWLCTELVLGT